MASFGSSLSEALNRWAAGATCCVALITEPIPEGQGQGQGQGQGLPSRYFPRTVTLPAFA